MTKSNKYYQNIPTCESVSQVASVQAYIKNNRVLNCCSFRPRGFKQHLYITILFACTLLATRIPATAQANIGSLGFEYSMLLRDSTGRPQPSSAVGLEIYLLPGQTSPPSAAVWAETQSVTTDTYGFATAIIGNGTRIGGTAASFGAVDFSNAASTYWVLIEVYNPKAGAYQAFIKEALTSVPYAKVAATLTSAPVLPPGVITPFAGDVNNIPAGWLLCNGQELDNTNPLYQPLFNAIGFNWGTSDGRGHKFNVPGTADAFLQGAVDPAVSTVPAADYARDSSAPGSNTGFNVGSYQQDAFIKHQHPAPTFGPNTSEITLPSFTGMYEAPAVQTTSLMYTSSIGAGGLLAKYGNPKVSPYETRPVNVAVNYIIKL